MEDLPGYYDTFNEFGKNSLYYSIVIGYVGVKMEPGWIVFVSAYISLVRISEFF